MSRAIYANLLFTVGAADWLWNQLHPEQNAGNWAAAIAGAFIIRLVLPKIPFGASVSGWFAATVFALLFSSTIIKHHWFSSWEPFAVYGFVALVGDALLQLLALDIRLSQKLGNYTLENPGDALDETFKRAEQITTVWGRIKVNALDLFTTFFK